LSDYYTIDEDDVLPPNLLELKIGDAAAVASLLRLTRLQLLQLRVEAMPAAELRQLTSLKHLASVALSYWGTAQQIDAAADGWCALPLRHLTLSSADGSSLQRSTLMQLSKLTHLSKLTLVDCVSDNSIQPERLVNVLAKLKHLAFLKLARGQQAQQQQQLAEAAAGAAGDAEAAAGAAGDAEAAAGAAGDAAAAAAAQDDAADAAAGSCLERFLHKLSRCPLRKQLVELNLERQRIGRADAAALGKLKRLFTLELCSCDLEDFIVIDIASALSESLLELNVSSNPRVTDACLPALERLVELGYYGMQVKLTDTAVTEEGLRMYLPDSLLYC
jgi:hypothetical protein